MLPFSFRKETESMRNRDTVRENFSITERKRKNMQKREREWNRERKREVQSEF